jgi:hypothetical protein
MTASLDNTHSITEADKRTTAKEIRQCTKSDSLGAHYVFGAPKRRLTSATNLNSLSINIKMELYEI